VDSIVKNKYLYMLEQTVLRLL